MKRLTKKVAVVTGGNGGIGFAIGRAFTTEGAQVVLVGRRADAMDAAVKKLGSQVTGLVGDVADLDTHDRVAALIRERFGGLDIYVANAGINRIQQSIDVMPADYDAQFLTNARATFFGVQKIMPLLRESGAIILTSSIAARKVLDGHAVYAGTKAAIETFARSWALELKGRRIRVNVLSPGPTKTPIIEKLGVSADAIQDFEQGLAQTIPFGRMGDADELARAAVFLASADSSFVTGINLAVDGGMTLI